MASTNESLGRVHAITDTRVYNEAKPAAHAQSGADTRAKSSGLSRLVAKAQA